MTRIHKNVRLIEQMETLFQAGSLSGLSDGALLDRFQTREAAGSEAAFAELVRRHGPMVFGACRRILVDSHHAEDALQATFLVLARRAGSVRNREALGGWLHRVACRIAGRLRKRVDRRGAKEEPMVEELAAKAGDRAEDRELRAIVDQEIDRLRDVQRLPVVLCCLQGLSHEQASERLRWPLGTVKSRLARGREKLQARLIRRGVAPTLATAALTGGTPYVEAAAVSWALVKSTAALAWKAGFAGAGASAAVASLVGEELGSVLALKLKVGAALMMGGLAFATAGYFGPVSRGQKPTGEEAARPSPSATTISASGRVVDMAGDPIAGAKVRGLMRGGTLDGVLGERTTDAEGRFAFKDVPAPGFLNQPEERKTIFPWDLVATAPEHGLAWVHLTRANQSQPITLTLSDEGIVHGKVVEPGGKPVVEAKITVVGIDRRDQVNGEGLERKDPLELSFSDLIVVTTDGDGRFMIRGLPVGKVASLVVTKPRYERLFALASADAPNSTRVADVFEKGSMTILHGDLTLTARVNDHVLRGRVIFEADGKPATKATLMNGGGVVKLDGEGRFRLEGLVPGKTKLRAQDDTSDAAPVEVEIAIPETPKETEYTLAMPRGLVVRGRIVDGASGKGLANIKVRYTEEPRSARLFAFHDETDASGRYRLVVPPGSGFVDVMIVPAEFVRAEPRYTGEPPGASYSSTVEGQAGQTIEPPDIALRRKGESVLRVVDQAGQPVFNAEVRLFDEYPDPKADKPRTDLEGRCRILRDLGKSATVDVLSMDRLEGATVEIPRDDASGKNAGEIEVRLQPVGSLSGRVVDENGEPQPGATPVLDRTVVYPDRFGAKYVKPIDTDGGVAKDGVFLFKGLVPDAMYSVHVEAGVDEIGVNVIAKSEDVKIKSGEETALKELRLPATDQELTGIVVDPRGEPISGATVSYQHDARNDRLFAPNGAVWFQDTGASGRFRLTGLPRGLKRLMVFRNEGIERPIRNPKYIDVKPGQKEVLIELDVVEGLQ